MVTLRRSLLLAPLVFWACEDDALFVAPTPPDTGVVIPADTGVVTPDAGFMDAEVPDMGFEPPPARAPIYIHSGDTLFSYDTDTNQANAVAQFFTRRGELRSMVDIAIDLEGRIYGGTSDRKIYSIDPTTAECVFRFEFDDILHGLTFLDDGRLVVAGERVSIVDPQNGDVILEIRSADRFETSGDIVGLPDGNLYWTVRNRDREAGDGVVRIDGRSGETQWLGEAEITKIYGLGFSDDALFGFSDDGEVVKLDPRSGRVLERRQLDGRWWGATTNPVLWN